MKKLILTLVTILVLNLHDWAAVPSISYPMSHKVEIPGDPVQSLKIKLRIIQMRQFIELTPEKYWELRGKKLNFVERFSFKTSQRRMKKMLKQYESGDGPTTLQKISWLLKGLILGPIALLIGYLFLKDEERELIKWIWFGFAGFVIIVVALLLSL